MRKRIEAILWILRPGAPWRDLPVYFGSWQSVYDRFRAWTKNGLWTAILRGPSKAGRDDEYLMIDSSAMRVHAHGSNPVGGQMTQAMGRSRAGLSTQVHMACDALGYALGFILTGANVSDFDQAKPLLRRHLRPNAHAMMDKGYDSDAIREYVIELGGTAGIAVKQNRSEKPAFDEHLYRATSSHRKPLGQAQAVPTHRHAIRKTSPLIRCHALTRMHLDLASSITLYSQTLPR